MNLHQIAAGCPKLLPDVRNRVETNHVHTLVAQVQHVIRHVVKYRRVPVIQIPLVRIKGCHDNLSRFLAPGEIPRSCRRKDLGDRLFKFIRDRPVIKEKVPVLVFLLAGSRSPGPFMVLAGMVHHEIKAQAHAPPMAGIRKRLQILHASKRRIDTPEIGYGIASVAAPLRTLQKRHQVEVIHSALPDIIQVLLHSLQIPGKTLGIHQHSDQCAILIPCRKRFPGFIQPAKLFFPLRIIAVQHREKILKCILIPMVQFPIQPLHLIVASGKPFREHLIPVLSYGHVFPLFTFWPGSRASF